MRYISLIFVLLTTAASGSQATIGPNGIDSLVTGLDGIDILIGQAEDRRSSMFGYDDPQLSASNTVPMGVYFQNDSGMAAPNTHLGQHATYVAGVMIGWRGDYQGVAPDADLNSIAISDIHDDFQVALALNRLALLDGGVTRAINLSFGGHMQSFIEGPDGNTHFTQFVDWSARRHNVLYVVAWPNADAEEDFYKPADSYNAIIVAASQKINDEGAYRKFAISNATNTNTGTQQKIDLLAPGFDVEALGWGSTAAPQSGASFAAPHVTGAVALLQQYSKQQMELPEPNPRFDDSSQRHEVMKAVILNSADKLAGVHGSQRTILDSNDNDWTQSEAYLTNDIPLDDQLGAGHLNVRQSFQQLSAGEYDPGTVPGIAWDYHAIGGFGARNEYVFDSEIGGYITFTLVWDRISMHTGGSDSTYNHGDMFVTDGMLDSNDLNVYLLPASSNDINQALAVSANDNDSVEHEFRNVPSGLYKLVVENSALNGIGTSQNYALAWWFGDSSQKPGDYSDNGSVGQEDYDLWFQGFGTTNTATDGNNDGIVNAADYVLWRKFLEEQPGSSSTVPEPGTVFFILIAIVFLNSRACRSRFATGLALS